MGENEYATHESLVQWWASKYPRERLEDEDHPGTPSWHGKEMLRELKQFTVQHVKDAMKRMLAEDKPKSLPRVVAMLKNNHSVIGESSWLSGVLDGTVVRRGSYTGIVVGEEVWVEKKTPIYEISYWCMVLPDSLKSRWGFLDPIKAGGWKDEMRQRIEREDFDGGMPSPAFADAIRADHALVRTSQIKRPKPAAPEQPKRSPPRITRIGEIRFDVPETGTTVPVSSTDADEEAAIREEYAEVGAHPGIIPGENIGKTPPEGDLF